MNPSTAHTGMPPTDEPPIFSQLDFKTRNSGPLIDFLRNALSSDVYNTSSCRWALAPTGLGSPLITITEDPSATPRARGTEGLHHWALLYPSRDALTGAVKHLELTITQDTYPGTLFMAHGGYHRHLGIKRLGGVPTPPLPTAPSIGLMAIHTYRTVHPRRHRLFRDPDLLLVFGA